MTQYEDMCMRLYWDCQELMTRLADGEGERTDLILSWLSSIEDKYPRLPEFRPEWGWHNVDTALSLDRLKGHVSLFDFFTYCCINCMHILPDLEKMEHKWGDRGLTVVGIHSAKFENEKNGDHLGHAISRYNIKHPVCNDSQAWLWNTLGVTCWPTQLLLGPHGKPIWIAMGEGHAQFLDELVSVFIDYYGKLGQLNGQKIETVDFSKVKGSLLKYPGKILVKEGKIVISDSGHHRILITDLHGNVTDIIGDGRQGCTDGVFSEAQFRNPQGICLIHNKLYVCDTDNHLIRCIDLNSRTVETIAGTGVMGTDREGGKEGINQEICSPWDLCYVNEGGSEGLLIAMAGAHQIWLMCLSDISLWKHQYTKGVCVRVIGSGKEENRNNSYPHKAGLAQPSGICCNEEFIFLADSESSTIRKISRKDGAVKNFCGGERDPTNLFAYGDIDGDGIASKLQHPLGVAVDEEGVVYVADSYNHKVKTVTGNKASVSSLKGGEEALSEPGGLFVYGEQVFIADTNNHCIKVLDTVTGMWNTMNVLLSDSVDNTSPREVIHSTVSHKQGSFTLKAQMSLAEGLKLSNEAESWWTLSIDQESWTYPSRDSFSLDLSIAVNHPSMSLGDKAILELSMKIYICSVDKLCMVRNFKYVVYLTASEDSGDIDLGKILIS